MRCLTLAEAVRARGHEALLMMATTDVDWLASAVRDSGLPVHPCAADELPIEDMLALEPDWTVVDSYRIPAASVSDLAGSTAVLAIVDGETRGIDATLFLDQNLGAERRPPASEQPQRFLAGSRYALVRDAITRVRRSRPWLSTNRPPTVLCFMGGSDPTSACTAVAMALSRSDADMAVTFVAPESQHGDLHAIAGGRSGWTVTAPTLRLPELFAEADIVVSAAGTSAWDLCALGIPSVLVAVVDNQQASLREVVAGSLALGIDVVAGGPERFAQVRDAVESLLADETLRRDLSESARKAFDGDGAMRVAERMEFRNTPGERREGPHADR